MLQYPEPSTPENSGGLTAVRLEGPTLLQRLSTKVCYSRVTGSIARQTTKEPQKDVPLQKAVGTVVDVAVYETLLYRVFQKECQK